MKNRPGLGDRVRERLRALGYWKNDHVDVLGFCRAKNHNHAPESEEDAMSALLTILGLALALAGCTMTPLADMRNAPPIREASVVSERPRSALATCAMDALESGWNGPGLAYRLLERPLTETSLLGQAFGVFVVYFEATFTANGHAVLIATRASGPGTSRIESEFWPIVERCAGTKVVTQPPLS